MVIALIVYNVTSVIETNPAGEVCVQRKDSGVIVLVSSIERLRLRPKEEAAWFSGARKGQAARRTRAKAFGMDYFYCAQETARRCFYQI